MYGGRVLENSQFLWEFSKSGNIVCKLEIAHLCLWHRFSIGYGSKFTYNAIVMEKGGTNWKWSRISSLWTMDGIHRIITVCLDWSTRTNTRYVKYNNQCMLKLHALCPIHWKVNSGKHICICINWRFLQNSVYQPYTQVLQGGGIKSLVPTFCACTYNYGSRVCA